MSGNRDGSVGGTGHATLLDEGALPLTLCDPGPRGTGRDALRSILRPMLESSSLATRATGRSEEAPLHAANPAGRDERVVIVSFGARERPGRARRPSVESSPSG